MTSFLIIYKSNSHIFSCDFLSSSLLFSSSPLHSSPLVFTNPNSISSWKLKSILPLPPPRPVYDGNHPHLHVCSFLRLRTINDFRTYFKQCFYILWMDRIIAFHPRFHPSPFSSPLIFLIFFIIINYLSLAFYSNK